MASGMISGRSSEKLDLPALLSKMKCDPQGYESELLLIHDQFKTSLTLFHQQAAMGFTGFAADPSVARDFGEDLSMRAMFLASVTPFYPDHLSEFPSQLLDFLSSSAFSLPPLVRHHATQAITAFVNGKTLNIWETLPLFLHLQTLGGRYKKEYSLAHVVNTVEWMNRKHKNEAENRALQNVLFSMLQQEDKAMAKRALRILCELHKRKVWFDDRTANAICTACFHTSPKVMAAALSFLLDYEKISDDADADHGSSREEDEFTPPKGQIIISRKAEFIKAQHKGTVASTKKTKADLQRVIRGIEQLRLSSGSTSSNQYSPLNHLKDAHGFVESLFSRLQTFHEPLKVKKMILKVIFRAVVLHGFLLNFYPFLEEYIQASNRKTQRNRLKTGAPGFFTNGTEAHRT